MSGNKLFTLKEIANELGVNYKTVHHYKDVFEEFVAVQLQGRRIRYQPVNVNLFSKILELKDEGYSNEDVRETLRTLDSENLKVYLSDGLTDHLTGRASDYPSDRLSDCLSEGPTICPSDDLSDGRSDGLSEQSGADEKEESVNQGRDFQEGLDPLRSETFSQIKEDLEAQISDKVSEQVRDQVATQVNQGISQLLSTLEECLLKMSSETNGAMTQVYKAICQVQSGMQNLEKRLGKLEEDLGEGRGEHFGLEQLDLNQLQLNKPAFGIEMDVDDQDQAFQIPGDQEYPAASHADLDFVRASIQDGRPDKTAVIQWINAERQIDPSMSYGHLANKLSEAGIPTLSGRDNWSRAVVRNLAVKCSGNE